MLTRSCIIQFVGGCFDACLSFYHAQENRGVYTWPADGRPDSQIVKHMVRMDKRIHHLLIIDISVDSTVTVVVSFVVRTAVVVVVVVVIVVVVIVVVVIVVVDVIVYINNVIVNVVVVVCIFVVVLIFVVVVDVVCPRRCSRGGMTWNNKEIQ